VRGTKPEGCLIVHSFSLKDFFGNVSVLNRKNLPFPPCLACVACGLTSPPCNGLAGVAVWCKTGFCQPTGKPAYNRIVGNLLYFILQQRQWSAVYQSANIGEPVRKRKSPPSGGLRINGKYRYFSLPRKLGS
jgi:hypothetical protein